MCWVVRAPDRLSHYDRKYMYKNRSFRNVCHAIQAGKRMWNLDKTQGAKSEESGNASLLKRCASSSPPSVLPFLQKYRLGHPKNYVLFVTKNYIYWINTSKHNLIKFEKIFTGHHASTPSQWWQLTPTNSNAIETKKSGHNYKENNMSVLSFH